MIMDDNDGQMIFGDLGGLKLPDSCLTGEEKPRKNLTQETCPDRGSNPGPLLQGFQPSRSQFCQTLSKNTWGFFIPLFRKTHFNSPY